MNRTRTVAGFAADRDVAYKDFLQVLALACLEVSLGSVPCLGIESGCMAADAALLP